MPSIDDSKCILVTGATAGIGRALSLALAKLPSKPRVIGLGRREDRLKELAKAGLETIQFDSNTDSKNLKTFADGVLEKYPDLDTIIYNAGVQYEFDFQNEINFDKLTTEININYTSVVTLISHFMPHFLKLSEEGRPSFIVTVTSGLAIVPAAWIPNYSATKAALHSFTISLRAQLQKTKVNVIEIIPPLVESELHDDAGTTNRLSRFWMPIDQYIENTVGGLRKGERVVTCGAGVNIFSRFEEGKEEEAAKLMQFRSQW
ncbi:hypothetical protein APHAL10511_005734 [Amanita phalloides]|nr:hypothetical protein APHAL10511_005734 [Amanita phalloides]